MTAEVHFIQAGDEPVLTGAGSGTLTCACGHLLAAGHDPDRLLGVAIRCARCGKTTLTPPLATDAALPAAMIVAEPATESRTTALIVPPRVSVIGRAEMNRLQGLYRPVTPTENTYRMSAELLDAAASAYERHVGDTLPRTASASDEPYRGFRDHPLSWAVGHLRDVTRAASWDGIRDEATAVAALHVAGFLHFVATWSHHPVFPAMAATAAERGCDLHGLAPFAAAHCLNMMGNRIDFPKPLGYPGRIDGFALLTGPEDGIAVHIQVLDRFALPFGRLWTHASLRAAIEETIERARGRINLRDPGLLVLSPGIASGLYDQALNQAMEAAMLSLGRKNRGLMAVAAILPMRQPAPDPAAIRFGYGFLPVANRRYQGENQLLMNSQVRMNR